MINPEYYTHDNIECFDVMEITQGKKAVLDFCVCNCFKYLYRHQFKNQDEDLKKAYWYLSKYFELKNGEDNELHETTTKKKTR